MEEIEYNKVLNLYNEQDFTRAFNLSSNKITQNNEHSSRYYLINILSEFKATQDTNLFKLKLQKGFDTYKNESIGKRCLEILETIVYPLE